jgi:hypothetical protein
MGTNIDPYYEIKHALNIYCFHFCLVGLFYFWNCANSGTLNILQPYSPPWPVTWIAILT